jgi:hypothetical protein
MPQPAELESDQQEVALKPEVVRMAEALGFLGAAAQVQRAGEPPQVTLPSVVSPLEHPLADVALARPFQGQIRPPRLSTLERLNLSDGVLRGIGKSAWRVLTTERDEKGRLESNAATLRRIEQTNQTIAEGELDWHDKTRVLQEWHENLGTSEGYDNARQTINEVLRESALRMKGYSIPNTDKQIGLGPLTEPDRLGHGLRMGIVTLDKRGGNPEDIVNKAEAGRYGTLKKCQIALVIGQRLAWHKLREAARKELQQNIKILSLQGSRKLVDRAGQAIRADVLNEVLSDASPEMRERLAEFSPTGEPLEEEWLEEAKALQENAVRIYRNTLDRFRQHHFVDRDPYQDPEGVLESLLRVASGTESTPLEKKLAISVTQQLTAETELAQEWQKAEKVLDDAAEGGDVALMQDKLERQFKIKLLMPTQAFLGDIAATNLGARALLEGTRLQTKARGKSEVLDDIATIFSGAINIIERSIEKAMTGRIEFVEDEGFHVVTQPLALGSVLQAALLEIEPARDNPANKLFDHLLMNTAEGHRVMRELLETSASNWKKALLAMPEVFVVALTNFSLGVEKWKPNSDALPTRYFQTLVECTAHMLGTAMKHLGNKEASDELKDAGYASVGLAGALVKILSPREVRMMKETIEAILDESPENPDGKGLTSRQPLQYVFERMLAKVSPE